MEQGSWNARNEWGAAWSKHPRPGSPNSTLAYGVQDKCCNGNWHEKLEWGCQWQQRAHDAASPLQWRCAHQGGTWGYHGELKHCADGATNDHDVGGSSGCTNCIWDKSWRRSSANSTWAQHGQDDSSSRWDAKMMCGCQGRWGAVWSKRSKWGSPNSVRAHGLQDQCGNGHWHEKLESGCHWQRRAHNGALPLQSSRRGFNACGQWQHARQGGTWGCHAEPKKIADAAINGDGDMGGSSSHTNIWDKSWRRRRANSTWAQHGQDSLTKSIPLRRMKYILFFF